MRCRCLFAFFKFGGNFRGPAGRMFVSPFGERNIREGMINTAFISKGQSDLVVNPIKAQLTKDSIASALMRLYSLVPPISLL